MSLSPYPVCSWIGGIQAFPGMSSSNFFFFFSLHFPSSEEHKTSTWPHKWKRAWGFPTAYNFFTSTFGWATQMTCGASEHFKGKAPSRLHHSSTSLFDNLETKDRVSSLNLNITWIMRVAGMLDGRLRIQNDFSYFREMLWKWLKFS